MYCSGVAIKIAKQHWSAEAFENISGFQDTFISPLIFSLENTMNLKNKNVKSVFAFEMSIKYVTHLIWENNLKY
jgi:hypothetical protein